ncbi:MAG: M3 family metallopeptidase [Bdellovibrionota bacterium]
MTKYICRHHCISVFFGWGRALFLLSLFLFQPYTYADDFDDIELLSPSSTQEQTNGDEEEWLFDNAKIKPYLPIHPGDSIAWPMPPSEIMPSKEDVIYLETVKNKVVLSGGIDVTDEVEGKKDAHGIRVTDADGTYEQRIKRWRIQKKAYAKILQWLDDIEQGKVAQEAVAHLIKQQLTLLDHIVFTNRVPQIIEVRAPSGMALTVSSKGDGCSWCLDVDVSKNEQRYRVVFLRGQKDGPALQVPFFPMTEIEYAKNAYRIRNLYARIKEMEEEHKQNEALLKELLLMAKQSAPALFLGIGATFTMKFSGVTAGALPVYAGKEALGVALSTMKDGSMVVLQEGLALLSKLPKKGLGGAALLAASLWFYTEVFHHIGEAYFSAQNPGYFTLGLNEFLFDILATEVATVAVTEWTFQLLAEEIGRIGNNDELYDTGIDLLTRLNPDNPVQFQRPDPNDPNKLEKFIKFLRRLKKLLQRMREKLSGSTDEVMAHVQKYMPQLEKVLGTPESAKKAAVVAALLKAIEWSSDENNQKKVKELEQLIEKLLEKYKEINPGIPNLDEDEDEICENWTYELFPPDQPALEQQCACAKKERSKQLQAILSPEAITYEQVVHATDHVIWSYHETCGFPATLTLISGQSASSQPYLISSYKLYLESNLLARQVASHPDILQKIKTFLPDENKQNLTRQDKFALQQHATFVNNGAALPNAMERKFILQNRDEHQKITTTYSQKQSGYWNFTLTPALYSTLSANDKIRLTNILQKDIVSGMQITVGSNENYMKMLSLIQSEPFRKKLFDQVWTSGHQPLKTTVEGIIEKRQNIATHLGFEHTSAMSSKGSLLSTFGSVESYLASFEKMYDPKFNTEKDILLPKIKKFARILKRMKCGSSTNCTFYAHDWRYWMAEYEFKHYGIRSVDVDLGITIKQAIPLVLKKLGEFAGVTVTHLPDVNAYGTIPLMYFLIQRNGQNMGALYVDAYNRPGKRSGGFNVTIFPHRQMPSDPAGWKNLSMQEVRATNYIGLNLQLNEKLSLVELRYLAHEFGHVMHSVSNRTEFASISGSSAAPGDYRETPSAVFEVLAISSQFLTSLGVDHTKALNIEKLMDLYYFDLLARSLLRAKVDLALNSITFQTWSSIPAIPKKAFEEIWPFKISQHGLGAEMMSYMFPQALYGILYQYLIGEDIALDLLLEKDANMQKTSLNRFMTETIEPQGYRRPEEGLKKVLDQDWNPFALTGIRKLLKRLPF